MKLTTSRNVLPPIRPVRQADEWIETYLVRIARANGLRYPTGEDVNRLREAFLTSHDSNTGYDASAYFSDLPLWARKKLGSPIRYCPACFEQDRYVRARWRLIAFEMCTVHNIHLKIGLVEPALSVEVNYPKAIRLTDVTNLQIWEGATCPMPIDRRHASDLWAPFERDVNSSNLPQMRESLAWTLVVEHLLDAVVSSGHGPEVPLKGESRLSHRTRWLTKSGLRLSASKKGVLNFLMSITTHRERRAAAACLTSMMRECEAGSALLPILPLQYLHDRLLAMAPETYCPISNGALPPHYQREGYVSINYAEGLLGRDTNFVHYLVRANFFEKVEKVRFGHRIYIFVHKAEVEGCRRWLSGCMTPEQVMRYLQIDRGMYFALQRRGLLRPIVIGPWSFHRHEDIASMLTILNDVARPCPDNKCLLLPLFGTQLVGKGCMPQAFTAVLQEIRQGRLSLFRDPDKLGLNAYYVDLAADMRARQIVAGLRKEISSKRSGNNQLSLLEVAH